MVIIAETVIIGLTAIFAFAVVPAVVTAVFKNIEEIKDKFKRKPRGPPRPPPGRTRKETIDNARRILDMDIVNYYNFAFCGGTGVGKSTLINAFRGLDDVDRAPNIQHNMYRSAATGEWQTTDTVSQYAFRTGHSLQRVRLWDMPGSGTSEHPSDTYFDDNALYAFDFLIIVIDKELGEYEYKIIKEANDKKVPVAVVVNKLEQKIGSKIRKQFNFPDPRLEHYKRVVDSTIEEAKKRVSDCLKKKQLENIPIFVVSAFKCREFMRYKIVHSMLIEHEEDFSQEVSGNASLDEDVSRQETIHFNTIEQQSQSAETNKTAAEELEKLSSLCDEMTRLLNYIADRSADRRL